MTTTAADLKNLLAAMTAAENANDEADEAWGRDLGNYELEKAADRAYEAMFSAQRAFAKALESFTGGRIDSKTACRLIVAKRDELGGLVNRLAA